jgi:ADP-dependent NAD(P)H-hydrate dehydratase / NAD(P)H-hydrate epimerase
MRILDTGQMREADRVTIEDIGIPSIVLMENAGRQVVAAMEASCGQLDRQRVVLLCGRGNNGGDGFVAARVLHEKRVEVLVFVIGTVADVRGDARTNLDILRRLGIPAVEIPDEDAWGLHSAEISACDLIVDALFGTGLNAPLRGLFETIVGDVNGWDIPVFSIDLPSGLSADTHELIGPSIDASTTVTLGAPKLPLVIPPGELKAGDLVVAAIGIPDSVIASLDGPRIELLTPEEVRDLIEPRAPDAHKGDFGHAIVVAGSVGKTGAAHLAAMGALRSGAGLVTVVTPRSCQPIVAAMAPEYMTEPVAETPVGTIDAAALEAVLRLRADVIAVGPGLGRTDAASAFVKGLLERTTFPLVLDADALFGFGAGAPALRGRDGIDVIITPHPGEMARLVGCSTEEVQADRVRMARRFATARRIYVILKGYRTVIATPDGRVFINPTGRAGMSTGGTGDVLTGMVAAWFAQLLDAEVACKLAVYLHGLAGDLTEAEKGEIAMIAGDLISRLGDALSELTSERRLER